MASIRKDESVEKCENCTFYKMSGSRSGKCLRNPPTFVGIGPESFGEFVAVRSTWWCGEYQDEEDEVGN